MQPVEQLPADAGVGAVTGVDLDPFAADVDVQPAPAAAKARALVVQVQANLAAVTGLERLGLSVGKGWAI